MGPRISAPRSRIYETYFARCPCRKCGEVLSAPVHSEFLQQRSVRHTWMCDKCDYQFETLIWLNLPPLCPDGAAMVLVNCPIAPVRGAYVVNLLVGFDIEPAVVGNPATRKGDEACRSAIDNR